MIPVRSAILEPSALGGGYDGAWSFESTTTAGNCPTLVPVNVVVQGGRVISANSGASSPWGYVESDGTFAAKTDYPAGALTSSVAIASPMGTFTTKTFL